MASEDVLEMLEVFSRKLVDYRNEESAWQEISAIVYALAAEVRELRGKREHLRGELHRIVGRAFDLGTTHPGGPTGFSLHELAELVDAATGAENV